MMSAQSLQETRVFNPEHPDQSWINTALSLTALSEIQVSWLLKAFGISCSFISPEGAAKILEHTFQLTLPFLAYTPNDDSSTKGKASGLAIQGCDGAGR